MSRYLTAAIAVALVALLPDTASGTKQRFDLESFDDAPAGIIQPGQVIKLEHFRVETARGSTAIIQAARQQDDLAFGLSLGALDHAATTSFDLSFTKPRESVSFTIVLPPGAPTLESTAALFGTGGERGQKLAIENSLAGHRARIRMEMPKGETFDRLSLNLQRGAYIDEVKMVSPIIAEGKAADFDELPSGPLQGSLHQGHYLIQNNSRTAEIAASSDPETWGQVLTSSASNGNDVIVFFRTSRHALDLTVVPDPSGVPARIEFLSAGHFDTLHTIDVDPVAGPKRLSFTNTEAGKSIAGIRWTGGKLRIDDVTLRSE